MKLITGCPFVTNPVTSAGPKTKLARPYLYRREGVYYLRFRETGSAVKASTVSLKTTQRGAAMDATRRLSETLKAFHLDNPDASWQELREHLLWIAEGLLSTAHDVHSLSLWGDLYEDVGMNLTEIAATHRLSVIQHEHIARSKQVMIATQDRLRGDSVPLVNVIRELEGSLAEAEAPTTTTATTPIEKPSLSGPVLTFEALSALYLKDRAGEQKATTLSSTKFTHGVLIETLGGLDMRTHSRADLVALRDALVVSRKPSTVNQMLMKLSAVLNWAVDNGHLEKAYDKKLKFTKGLESTRKAFTQEQVGKLVAFSNALPETSWRRWLLSLGAITGGRLNEISQLTASDVRTLESGIVVIHINEVGEGKSIKNKRSERLVPLVDGAYGFDLAAFLRYVDGCGEGALAQIGYRAAGEWVNQTAIPEALGESYARGLVFHSFRHSLASLMQAKGVPTAHAQAVMGHATGTITFDVYGSGVPIEVLAELLEGLFKQTAKP